MKLARNTPAGDYRKADIALSAISTNFENLGDRLAETGIFHEVIALDEKREDFSRSWQSTGKITAIS